MSYILIVVYSSMVYVRLHQGIQGQKVNSDADKLLVKPFCLLYSDKIIQSIKTSLIPEES